VRAGGAGHAAGLTHRVTRDDRANLVRLVDLLSRRFGEAHDVHRLAEVAYDVVEELVDIEYSGFYFVEPVTEELRLFCTKGFTEEERQTAEVSAMERHPGIVMRTGDILHVPDVAADPEKQSRESPRSFHIASRLYLPLISHGTVIGAFGLGSTRTHAFTDFDISVLSFAAGAAGVAYGRIAAQRSLKAAEDRHARQLRAITDSARDAIVMIDDQGKVTFWNAAAVALFGYTEQDIIGQDLHTLVTPKEEHGTYRRGIRLFARTGDGTVVGQTLELQARTRDGQTVEIELSVAPVHLLGRWHAVGIARDIRERKEQQRALERSEQRFRNLAASLPEAVVEVEANGRVTYANTTALELFGYTEEDLESGLSFIDSFAPREWDRVKGDFAMVLQGVRLGFNEYTARYRDGLAFPAAVSATPTTSGNGRMRVLAILTDITERNDAEVQLRLAHQKLERRVQERTEELHRANARLRTQIAERMRTEQKLLSYQDQLRSLAARLTVAEDRERRRIATELHDRIGQTLSVCQMRLLGLSGDSMDDHSLTEVGEAVAVIETALDDIRAITFELSPPILYELGIEAAVDWLAEQTGIRHGLRCEVRCECGTLHLDEDVRVLTFQILRELVFNVAKHADASELLIRFRQQGRWLLAGVEDDGVGFPDVDYGGDEASLSQGFGLFSIRERLRPLGGELQIRSKPGAGATVVFRVPMAGGVDGG